MGHGLQTTPTGYRPQSVCVCACVCASVDVYVCAHVCAYVYVYAYVCVGQVVRIHLHCLFSLGIYVDSCYNYHSH